MNFTRDLDPPRSQLRAPIRLVRAGGSLAGLQLLEVPVADLHVAALLVHARGELLGRGLAVVVAGPLVLVRGLGLHRGLLGCGGLGGAAEHAAEGVADGRADGDTTENRLATE